MGPTAADFWNSFMNSRQETTQVGTKMVICSTIHDRKSSPQPEVVNGAVWAAYISRHYSTKDEVSICE